jgi:hypothetical protein
MEIFRAYSLLLLLGLLNGCGGWLSVTRPGPVPAQVIATVPVGMDAEGVAVNSATDRMYVANGGDGVSPGSVMVIDGVSGVKHSYSSHCVTKFATERWVVASLKMLPA